jgi:hypothetical protein
LVQLRDIKWMAWLLFLRSICGLASSGPLKLFALHPKRVIAFSLILCRDTRCMASRGD